MNTSAKLIFNIIKLSTTYKFSKVNNLQNYPLVEPFIILTAHLAIWDDEASEINSYIEDLCLT